MFVVNVLQDHGIAQTAPDGKAIWRASITSDTGWSHCFTFLKLAKTEETIADEDVADVPNSASAVSPPLTTATAASGMDGIDALPELLDASQMRNSPEAAPPSARELQAEDSRADTAPPVTSLDVTPATATEESQRCGKHFMDWLKRGIQTRKLIINDAKALVHTLAGTVYLVSPRNGSGCKSSLRNWAYTASRPTD